MPSTKPAASIVLVAVSVLVQYLLHSWFVLLQLVLYIPTATEGLCLATIILPQRRCLCCWTQTTYFLPYYRTITDNGGGTCSPYLPYGNGEPYMKISIFLKSRVRPLPVLPKNPNAYPCKNNARATFYDILKDFLINRTRLFTRCGCDNGGARKTSFLTRHIYCKNGGVT